jgi:hypothetical protein
MRADLFRFMPKNRIKRKQIKKNSKKPETETIAEQKEKKD